MRTVRIDDHKIDIVTDKHGYGFGVRRLRNCTQHAELDAVKSSGKGGFTITLENSDTKKKDAAVVNHFNAQEFEDGVKLSLENYPITFEKKLPADVVTALRSNQNIQNEGIVFGILHRAYFEEKKEAYYATHRKVDMKQKWQNMAPDKKEKEIKNAAKKKFREWKKGPAETNRLPYVKLLETCQATQQKNKLADSKKGKTECVFHAKINSESLFQYCNCVYSVVMECLDTSLSDSKAYKKYKSWKKATKLQSSSALSAAQFEELQLLVLEEYGVKQARELHEEMKSRESLATNSETKNGRA
jgi:hypothetical protein